MASASAALLGIMTSCIYDDIRPCDDKVEFTIVTDWRYAPDARPEGMAYMFFRRGVASPWRFDFPSGEAGKVTLEAGEYDFLTFNDDTSDIIFKDGSHGMPFVTTAMRRETVGDEDMDLYEAPDMMWSAFMAPVMVDSSGIGYETAPGDDGCRDPYSLVVTPRRITPLYTVRILHVGNLQGVAAMKGIISGMSPGIDLYRMERQGEGVQVSFSPRIASDSTVAARFCTFGVSETHGNANRLRLYFRLSDNSLQSRDYDVSATVASAPDPMNVEIVIDSISLPYSPPAESGAFDPSVAGWSTVVVNYGT